MKSLNYGQLPSRAEFRKAYKKEVGSGPYKIKFGLSDARHIGVPGNTVEYLTEGELWALVKMLIRAFEMGDEWSGDFASSVLYTLGFEWI